VNCLECGGACCQEIVLNAPDPEDTMAHAWLQARGGQPIKLGGCIVSYAIETRCPRLSPDGLCLIHETKPEACAIFEPGSPPCLGSISRRRTPEQAARIAGPCPIPAAASSLPT